MREVLSAYMLLAAAPCGEPATSSPPTPTPESNREPKAPDNASGLTPVGSGSDISIDATWKPCTVAADCVRVGTACDACCGEDAIRASFEEAYLAAFQRLCASYEGGQCDCLPAETTVECTQGRCDLMPVR